MERLTTKHIYTLGGLNGKQEQVSKYIVKKLGYEERDDIHQEVVDKLAEFEDLMEEYEIEDLRTALKNIDDTINQCLSVNKKTNNYKNQLVIENQQLKDRWELLKEYLNHEYKEELKVRRFEVRECFIRDLEDIIYKMRELEKGVEE